MWENHKYGSVGVTIAMKRPNTLGGVKVMVSTRQEPYTIPPEYTKHEDSIFMREDLVSWQKEEAGYPDGAYYRSVFKDPKGEHPLTKEDAKPVAEYPSRWAVLAQQDAK